MSDEKVAAAGPAGGAYDPHEVEGRWYGFWEQSGFFRADVNSHKRAFSMAIPPPNVTGSLHMGHALSYSIEDFVTRWHRMRGDETLWLPGVDHAGIATQMVVERELRKEGLDRRQMGREAFVARVWEWKERYGNRITEQMRILGFSPDWSRLRFTLDEGLSRAVRHVFVRLHRKGLIYRAERLINWCPRCLTALSDLEVDHEEVDGKLWHIAYAVEGSDRQLTVATTRPETLLGDTGVAVHPDDPRYRDLVGKRAVVPLVDRPVPIVADPVLVSMEFGTGAVKVTPAHDFDDFETGNRHGLARLSILDERGVVNAAGGAYAGLERFDARKKILGDLEARGALLKTEPHRLAIGHCQRCRTVVEPLLSKQWFVKMAPLATPAIAAVEQGDIRLFPESWKATYFHWLHNVHDWCISRQLWWGHQVPVWYCGCGEVVVAEETPERCPRCGGALTRDPDVLDTWFSSALWPFSTLGWPQQTAELARFYPTALLETGSDILFFWVARMIVMGIELTGQVPFRDVYLHAMVRDEHGEKMSKTKGNVIDPLDVTAEHGADALRFALAAQAGQGRDVKLSLAQVAGYRAFGNKIWNAVRFALMHLEGFAAGGREGPPPAGGLADRWIRSRLSRAAEETNAAFEAYRFSEAASSVYQFFWHELCDWYIELAKVTLLGGDPEARRATQRTLADVLDGALRLLHPFMPFLTEELWQKLPRLGSDPPSIMVASYPADLPRDGRSEREMDLVVRAVEGLRALRGENNLPPGKRIPAVIHARDEAVRAVLAGGAAFIRPLAQLSELQVLPARPAGAKLHRVAVAVEPEMELAVPLAGLIDFAEEERRLRKEIGKAEGDSALLSGKLENPNFVARAPPEVVAKDRARVGETEAKIRRLREQLAMVAGEETDMSEPHPGSFGQPPADPGEEKTQPGRPILPPGDPAFSPTVAAPTEAPIPLPTSLLPPGPLPLPAELPAKAARPPSRRKAAVTPKARAKRPPLRKLSARKPARKAKAAARKPARKARAAGKPVAKAKAAVRRPAGKGEKRKPARRAASRRSRREKGKRR